jgi:glycosyltransferase involved in cell wall biosynthesis
MRRFWVRIAVVDYRVVTTNPIGGCHRRMLEQLCDEHDLTVFAVEFDNPRPDRIKYVRIPVPGRPLFLLFVMFHLIAPIYYWLHCLRHRVKFDFVQTVESNSLLGTGSRFGQVVYAQFCHRRFLDAHWASLNPGGLRGFLRWLDHRLHAMLEPRVYRNCTRIVVASQGLKRELNAEFPATIGKVHVVANPVDVVKMTRPPDFDRAGVRGKHGWTDQDTVLVFVALGHFERKGLPLLLEAMTQLPASVKLDMVGGMPGLIAAYQKRVDQMGLSARVVFSGMQKDVRPHLWGADAFVLPSAYEVFPLVALEAAAAGVLLISSPLNGVEEFLRDGENGFLIERTADGVRRGIERLMALDPTARHETERRAQSDVSRYSIPAFGLAWRGAWSGLANRNHDKPGDSQLRSTQPT